MTEDAVPAVVSGEGTFKESETFADAVKVVGGVVFDENEVLTTALSDQRCRCAGCGLPLELGAAVLTTVRFPKCIALAAVHAECREGVRTIRKWDALVEVLQANDTDPAPVIHPATSAAFALLGAYRRWSGDPDYPVTKSHE